MNVYETEWEDQMRITSLDTLLWQKKFLKTAQIESCPGIIKEKAEMNFVCSIGSVYCSTPTIYKDPLLQTLKTKEIT